HAEARLLDAVEQLAHVPTFQAAQDRHFAPESPEDLAIAVEVRMNGLDGHDLVLGVDVEIARLVHRAGGALTDDLAELVAIGHHPPYFEDGTIARGHGGAPASSPANTPPGAAPWGISPTHTARI